MITSEVAPTGGADVIVVGAGLAGLTAAADLAATGRQVLVLEARPRIGGRIDSRPLVGGVAELGAQVLHGADNPVLELPGARAGTVVLGSAAMPADLVTQDGAVHDLASSGDLVPPPALFGALHALRRAVGGQLAQRITLTMALTMMKVSPDSARALPGWLEQITGADHSATSLERVCTEPVFAFRSDAEFTVPAGLATLLDPLTTDLPIHTGHVVRHVGRDIDGVLLALDTPDGSRLTLTADSVVLTVPPPVVASGDLIVEDLPEDQRAAARTLRLAPAVAAAVPLAGAAPSEAFRCDLAHGCGFLTWVGGRRHVSVVAKGQAAERLRVLLTEDQERLHDLVDAARASEPGRQDDSARAGGPRGPSVSAWAEVTTDRSAEIVWHDWAADPFATGAFTLPHEDATALGKSWSAPVAERIHFAGEATLAGPTSPFLERARASGLAASTRIQQITHPVGA